MYNFEEIEKKWQQYWEDNKTYKTLNNFDKPKYYCLDMFPFPSGAGLHVGHPKGMTANDIVARYKNANGYNVLHPMGWDAFGLPAENYAIKTGTHPSITTKENIDKFRKQIKSLGFSYDWDREIDTTDPKYYKWTQFIFLKLFEAGLAYEQDLPINYCPSCKTSVANEEVLNDFTHERCGTKVEKKKLRQWVLSITKYADRLLSDVDNLDWPESIKDMQRNWIGKSEGCEFKMKVVVAGNLNSIQKEISVYTTRIDTVFGMTYAVIAPDHKDVMDFITPEQKEVCLNYIQNSKSKSDQDRTASKEKTGVFTGSYLINPFNNEKIPLWIGDYVLGNYGTGAVMAVPAHDERDFEFAKKYNLEIRVSIESGLNQSPNLEKAFTGDGFLVNSGSFTGLSSEEARKILTEFAEKKGFGRKKVNYKLRDWLFSRQRYWGEPIPLIHLNKSDLKTLPKISSLEEAVDKNLAYILVRKPEKGEENAIYICPNDGFVKELVIEGKIFSKLYEGLYTKIVCDYNLPLKLPEVNDFEPSGDGNSPLAKVDKFVNVKLADNLYGKRETNTMPQWAGSCWYYLRYMDPNNHESIVNPEIEKYWGQVDSYVGGAEHAVLHLLYARFWHKFLYDIGLVSTNEPFFRLRNQGLILAYAFERKNGGLLANDLVEEKDGKYYEIETGEEVNRIISKMSKSLKNVVNPDDIIKDYGSDSLRLYEMYISDFKDNAPWDTKGIIGVKRFLEKSERLFTKDAKISNEDDNFTMKLLHKTIKKVSEDIENYKFNTAIASLMILVNNGLPKDKELQREFKKIFAIILSPFAPHLAEELWERINSKKVNSVYFEPWPKYDENLVKDDNMTIAIQVLGKLRGSIEVDVNETKENIISKAKELDVIKKWLDGKEIVKEIYVPGKIVNIVVK